MLFGFLGFFFKKNPKWGLGQRPNLTYLSKKGGRLMTERNFKRRFIPVVAFVLLLAVLCVGEYVWSNRLRLQVGDRPEQATELSQARLSGGARRTEQGIRLRSGACVLLEDLQTETADVVLCLTPYGEQTDLQALEVTLSFSDEANGSAFRAYRTVTVYADGENAIPLSSVGKLNGLQIRCNNGSALLTAVAINRLPPIRFSFPRVLLVFGSLLLLWCTWHFRWWKRMFDVKNRLHLAAVLVALLVCLLLLSVFTPGVAVQSVPLQTNNPNAYEQLFTSLLDGKLDLDVDCDRETLLALENPYDFTARSEAMGEKFGRFWDRSWYNGNFYCYFGIAPVLVVYFPIWFFTGCIPNASLAVQLLSVIGIVSLFGAVLSMIRYFRLRVPLPLLCIGLPGAVFGSLFYTLNVCGDMYYIAVAAGVSFLALTLWLGFAALNATRPILRRVLFACCALAMALTLASRPNVVLYGAVLIPPFLAVLTARGVRVRAKLADALAFLLPLVVAVIPILWYNMARFDSPFEFGATYQLTMSDISQNTLTLTLLWETVVHYFLQLPQLAGSFPYCRPSYLNLGTYGRYFYNAGGLGALCFPLAWGGLAQGFTDRKKQPVKRATWLLLLLLPFVVAFCDLCLGGMNLRYIIDLLLPLMLLGLLVIGELAGRCADRCAEKTSFLFFCFCALLCTLTVLLSLSLVFANERNWMYEYRANVFRFFASLFYSQL